MGGNEGVGTRGLYAGKCHLVFVSAITDGYDRRTTATDARSRRESSDATVGQTISNAPSAFTITGLAYSPIDRSACHLRLNHRLSTLHLFLNDAEQGLSSHRGQSRPVVSANRLPALCFC